MFIMTPAVYLRHERNLRELVLERSVSPPSDMLQQRLENRGNLSTGAQGVQELTIAEVSPKISGLFF